MVCNRLAMCTIILAYIGTIGIEISLPDSRDFTCRAVLISTSLDMPAKAQVMNMMQYNGFYGCNHCLQKGR